MSLPQRRHDEGCIAMLGKATSIEAFSLTTYPNERSLEFNYNSTEKSLSR
jgi:hypothetical protein